MKKFLAFIKKFNNFFPKKEGFSGPEIFDISGG
jgi:hypothetical protein